MQGLVNTAGDERERVTMARRRGAVVVAVLVAVAALVVVVVAGHAALPARGWHAVMLHRTALAGLVARHRGAAMLGVGAAYTLAVALSLPLGIWFSLLDGLLFGVVGGTALTVASCSLGAVAIFLIVRRFVGGRLTGPRVQALSAQLRRDGFFVLLSVRLMPVFPFWLVNLAAGAAGVRLAPFVVATVLGCVPTSLILAAIGAGFAADLRRDQPPAPGMLLQPGILVPLLGLAALAVSPVLWRRWRAQRLRLP
jgi:uncharacterized membrane protein YdjX (TVP38/TMEM64 family)